MNRRASHNRVGEFESLQSPFVHEVESSLISQDGHEIENLYSLDRVKRLIGFKVERFVRPPLSVDICFKIPINVHYLVLGIEGLHKENERCKVEFTITDKEALSFPTKQRFCGSYNVSVPLTLFHNPLSATSIAHLDNTINPNMVKGSHMFESLVYQQISSVALKPIRELTTVTNVTVCVKQYTSSNPLHLKCLEVWGTPSEHCSQNDLKIFEKARETCSFHEQNDSKTSITMYNSEIIKPTTQTASGNSELGVNRFESKADLNNPPTNKTQEAESPPPEQLLDQLTFELMVLPHRLPSGYCIDQLTVEKCKETDLLYGRVPCDPFTGIPYTESTQPQFCPKLKGDIDEYIGKRNDARHQSNTVEAGLIHYATGRTIGTAKDIENHRYHRPQPRISGSKRKLDDSIEIPRNVVQKPCPVSSDKVAISCEKQSFSRDHQNESPRHRKREHKHELTISNSLDEALKNLFPT